jgi:hypothetical protein
VPGRRARHAAVDLLLGRPHADLEAYAGSYLQQEIVAEGATRNIAAFSRFLRVAAHCNGTIVNFTNVASDAQVPTRSDTSDPRNTLVPTSCLAAESPSASLASSSSTSTGVITLQGPAPTPTPEWARASTYSRVTDGLSIMSR